MKIISRGVPPDSKPLRATCNRCKTVVEFLPGEAKFVFDQRDGNYRMIGCPVCSHPITVEAK